MKRLGLLVTVLFLATTVQAVEWPMFHNDPLHTGKVFGDFQPPKERWWSAGTGGPIHGSPVVADGRVFVGSTDGKMYAFDAISGSRLWVFDARDPIFTTPALAGGTLYFVTNGGKLFALDAVTGLRETGIGRNGEAQEQPGPSRTSPTIHEGRLFLGTEDGRLIAYNLLTLRKDWEFRASELRTTSPENSTYNADQGGYTRSTCEVRFVDRPIQSSPAVYNNKVFFGSDNHGFFALEEFGLGGAQAGKTQVVWRENTYHGLNDCPRDFPQTQLPGLSRVPLFSNSIRASPTIDVKNQYVIVASLDNTVRAFRIHDGSQAWQFNVTGGLGGDSRVISTPAVDENGVVYFGSFNGRFYAMRSTPSDPQFPLFFHWNQQFFQAGDAIWSSPALSNGFVAFGADDETVYVLDANTGQEMWRSRIGGDVRGSPAIWSGGTVDTPIRGGVLYVPGADGILYAFGGDKPALPDLRVKEVQVPSRLTEGRATRFVITVDNIGKLSNPETNLTVFIDGTLIATERLPKLFVNQSEEFTVEWTPTRGRHTLRVLVDPSMLSREFDRGNNEVIQELPQAQRPARVPTNTTDEGEEQPRDRRGPGVEGAVLLAGLGAAALVASRRRRGGPPGS